MVSPAPDDRIPNLGPVSRGWLSDVGINTLEELRQAGPLTAYLLVSQEVPNASLSLLWALVAAVSNRDWREIGPEEKAESKRQLSLLRDAQASG